jgi:hypothetical protein
MHLLSNAPHLNLQAKYLHCSGCHFELKQLGFTAAYRARQCLLTSRNAFISILRAGLLQPHGSESGTWHNRDLIRRHACAESSPCTPCASIRNDAGPAAHVATETFVHTQASSISPEPFSGQSLTWFGVHVYHVWTFSVLVFVASLGCCVCFLVSVHLVCTLWWTSCTGSKVQSLPISLFAGQQERCHQWQSVYCGTQRS